ncbi:VOC family protein [Vibrio sp. D404a]|uniref:VOC family protein n=1 Tax=unclassified Vibrio TaxID=2614977 RepID=UPI00255734CC|nr:MULTISPECIES: VOC family protein [unclassified Vibrio]MDK9737529.1 VOC family protein [Vibrio sp. D404a]MDK9797472.1 VOC family protein [Vibrio sp. D449a]
MQAYVEHANVTVSNIDDAIQFIQTAIPEFKVRHRGETQYRWCHIGTDNSYIALQKMVAREKTDRAPYLDVGINHIGLVVNDVDQVKQRLLSDGYQQNDIGEENSYRKRIYFYDRSGVEWEFIQYLTQDSTKKNSYED